MKFKDESNVRKSGNGERFFNWEVTKMYSGEKAVPGNKMRPGSKGSSFTDSKEIYKKYDSATLGNVKFHNFNVDLERY